MFLESKVSFKILCSNNFVAISRENEKIKQNTFIFLCLAINVTDISHTSNNNIANNNDFSFDYTFR